MFARTRSSIRLLPVLLAVVAALAAACGASGGHSKATPSPQHENEALQRSADNATKATSFSSTIRDDITTDGKTTVETGTTLFRAPNTTYMKLSVLGQDSEFLLAPPAEYIEFSGVWYDLGSAVINKDAYNTYAKNRGAVDYGGIVSVLKDAKQLPDDTIDGTAYSQYSGTLDLKDLVGKVPDDVFKPGVKQITQQLFQPAKVDVWIAPDTGLPKQLTMDMTMTVVGSSVESKLVMDYTSWNQPVDIPPLPTNAKPYSDLTGGLTPEDLTYIVQFSSALQALGKDGESLQNADLPNDTSQFTEDQRKQAETIIDAFTSDAAALKALTPSERFRPSYDAMTAALDRFDSDLDVLRRDVASPGSVDTTQAEGDIEAAAQQFEDAAKEFASELPSKQ